MGAISPYKGRKGFSAMWMQQEKGQKLNGTTLKGHHPGAFLMGHVFFSIRATEPQKSLCWALCMLFTAWLFFYFFLFKRIYLAILINTASWIEVCSQTHLKYTNTNSHEILTKGDNKSLFLLQTSLFLLDLINLPIFPSCFLFPSYKLFFPH